MSRVMTTGQYRLRTQHQVRVIKNFAHRMLESNKRDFHILGAQVLFRTVYSEHPEGDYQRTFNLFNSFASIVEKEPRGASLTLYIDPDEDIRSYSGEDLYAYYPPYVLQGNFFSKQAAPRPFVERWTEEVGELVFQRARDYIDENIVRVI